MTRKPRSRRWIGRLILVIGSIGLALGLGEAALRVLRVAPPRWAQSRHLESPDKRHGLDVYPTDPRGYFPLDLRNDEQRAGWRSVGIESVDEHYRVTPYAVPFRYTRELCRGRRSRRRFGKRRIVFVGDSFTEGQGVRERDTYVQVLGRDLRRAAEVWNCGRRGDDFPLLRERFDDRLALNPDLVVYAMVLNDPQRSEEFEAQQPYLNDWILDRRRMLSEGPPPPPEWYESRLLSLVSERMDAQRVGEATTRWYRGMVSDANRAGWQSTLEQIVEMRDAVREQGGEFLVVLWPLFVDLDDYPFAEVHETIGRALERRSIPFVDTLDAFRGRDPRHYWVHPLDHHPNERAHFRFAEAIEPTVRAMLSELGERS